MAGLRSSAYQRRQTGRCRRTPAGATPARWRPAACRGRCPSHCAAPAAAQQDATPTTVRPAWQSRGDHTWRRHAACACGGRGGARPCARGPQVKPGRRRGGWREGGRGTRRRAGGRGGACPPAAPSARAPEPGGLGSAAPTELEGGREAHWPGAVHTAPPGDGLPTVVPSTYVSRVTVSTALTTIDYRHQPPTTSSHVVPGGVLAGRVWTTCEPVAEHLVLWPALFVCAYMRASRLFFMSLVSLEFYSHTWSTCLLDYLCMSPVPIIAC